MTVYVKIILVSFLNVTDCHCLFSLWEKVSKRASYSKVLFTPALPTLCFNKKTTRLIFDYNFSKWKPIVKILALMYSHENFLCICYRDFHLTLTTLLHYLVKFENSKLQPNAIICITLVNLFHSKFSKT